MVHQEPWGTQLFCQSTNYCAESPFTVVSGGCRYDHLDMLFHIFSSLKVSGYQGVPIHNITRDEVQDFTQAELLVDLRCAINWLNQADWLTPA